MDGLDLKWIACTFVCMYSGSCKCWLPCTCTGRFVCW